MVFLLKEILQKVRGIPLPPSPPPPFLVLALAFHFPNTFTKVVPLQVFHLQVCQPVNNFVLSTTNLFPWTRVKKEQAPSYVKAINMQDIAYLYPNSQLPSCVKQEIAFNIICH